MAIAASATNTDRPTGARLMGDLVKLGASTGLQEWWRVNTAFERSKQMTKVSVLLAAAACLVVGAPHSPTLAKGCAPPRTFEGFCTQVVVWAKNWRTGACCRYPNPCSVPKGYQIYDRPGCGKRASSAPRAALSRAENHGQLISLVPVWFAPLAEKAQQHACDDAPTAPRSDPRAWPQHEA